MAGDIPLINNFNLTAAKPLDGRDKVALYSDLAGLSGKYEGMRVYVVEHKTHYILYSDLTTWNPEYKITLATLAAAQAHIVGRTQTYLIEVLDDEGNGNAWYRFVPATGELRYIIES